MHAQKADVMVREVEILVGFRIDDHMFSYVFLMCLLDFECWRGLCFKGGGSSCLVIGGCCVFGSLGLLGLCLDFSVACF